MSLLRLAVNTSRWDLAACAIILAGARTLEKGVKPDARKREKKPNNQKKNR